jgi:hypothetical protein
VQQANKHSCITAMNNLLPLPLVLLLLHQAGEGLQLLDWSVSAKAQLKSWLGYDMVAPRVRVYYKEIEKKLQGAPANGWPGQQAAELAYANIGLCRPWMHLVLDTALASGAWWQWPAA